MSEKVWDRCPYCNFDIAPAILSEFNDREQQAEFDMTCEWCESEFRVLVHTVPEFECTKKD